MKTTWSLVQWLGTTDVDHQPLCPPQLHQHIPQQGFANGFNQIIVNFFQTNDLVKKITGRVHKHIYSNLQFYGFFFKLEQIWVDPVFVIVELCRLLNKFLQEFFGAFILIHPCHKGLCLAHCKLNRWANNSYVTGLKSH